MPKLPFEIPNIPIDPLVFLAAFGIIAAPLLARNQRPWLAMAFAFLGGFCLAMELQRRGFL